MFIAIPLCLKDKALDVSPNFWRLQALIISFRSVKLLLINSYFPTDSMSNRADISDLLETLHHIKHVVATAEFDHLVLAGDLNTDFIRNTSHVSAVKEFIEETSLNVAWDHYDVDFTHFQEVNLVSSVSKIDHFLWTDSMSNNIIDCGVLHHPSNLSDHSSIYCKIQVDTLQSNSISMSLPTTSKPCWRRTEQKNNYINKLEAKLTSISIPDDVVKCSNAHCKNKDHIEELDSFVISVLESVDAAANQSLFKSSPRNQNSTNKRIIPGWSSIVQPYRDTAYFWHQLLHANTPSLFHHQCYYTESGISV